MGIKILKLEPLSKAIAIVLWGDFRPRWLMYYMT